MNDQIQTGLLRTMTDDDVRQVLAWRNSDHVRSFMLTSHLISLEEHLAWFSKLKARDDQKALIFSWHGQDLGAVFFTQINLIKKTAHWGFYIGVVDAPQGAGTALGEASLHYAFETLGVEKLHGEVIAFNARSRKLFERLGFCERNVHPNAVDRDGVSYDLLCYDMTYDLWQQHVEQKTTVPSKESSAL